MRSGERGGTRSNAPSQRPRETLVRAASSGAPCEHAGLSFILLLNLGNAYGYPAAKDGSAQQRLSKHVRKRAKRA